MSTGCRANSDRMLVPCGLSVITVNRFLPSDGLKLSVPDISVWVWFKVSWPAAETLTGRFFVLALSLRSQSVCLARLHTPT